MIPHGLRIEVLFYVIIQLIEIGVIVMLIKWILGQLGITFRNILMWIAVTFGLIGLKKWLDRRKEKKIANQKES